MDRATAETAVRQMLDSIRDANKLTDLAHGFEIVDVRAEPHDNYGIPGGPHWTVYATVRLPALAEYHLPGLPVAAVDHANLDLFRSEVTQRIADRRIGVRAMARSLRWEGEPLEEPELKQHPDDDLDPHWIVSFSVVVP